MKKYQPTTSRNEAVRIKNGKIIKDEWLVALPFLLPFGYAFAIIGIAMFNPDLLKEKKKGCGHNHSAGQVITIDLTSDRSYLRSNSNSTGLFLGEPVGLPPLTNNDKAGLVVSGSMAPGIVAGAATGFALGGPVGAVAGAIIGNLAGGAAGSVVADKIDR